MIFCIQPENEIRTLSGSLCNKFLRTDTELHGGDTESHRGFVQYSLLAAIYSAI